MNMENFITGFSGQEYQHRAAMLKVLGKEKYEFFFDKFLEYFFMEDDAKFFASLGLNCLRLPFNYRHFEDDMNPRVLKESGFKHLDRVIELVGIFQVNASTHVETISAQNTKSTQSSICTLSRVPKTQTGIPTTQATTPHSGTIKTIKTEPSGSGHKSPLDIVMTPG